MAEKLRKGEFAAAVVDISIGHDPDLYPLLASSQTQTGGLNVAGVQDAALDALLALASPAPTRPGRPPTRPSRRSSRPADTCSRSPSPTRSWWSVTRSRMWSSSPSRTGRIATGMC